MLISSRGVTCIAVICLSGLICQEPAVCKSEKIGLQASWGLPLKVTGQASYDINGNLSLIAAGAYGGNDYLFCSFLIDYGIFDYGWGKIGILAGLGNKWGRTYCGLDGSSMCGSNLSPGFIGYMIGLSISFRREGFWIKSRPSAFFSPNAPVLIHPYLPDWIPVYSPSRIDIGMPLIYPPLLEIGYDVLPGFSIVLQSTPTPIGVKFDL